MGHNGQAKVVATIIKHGETVFSYGHVGFCNMHAESISYLLNGKSFNCLIVHNTSVLIATKIIKTAHKTPIKHKKLLKEHLLAVKDNKDVSKTA